jgi:hypothetical protein
MKKLILIALIIIKTQFVFSQEAAIYCVVYKADEALITEIKAETTTNRAFLTGISSQVEIPANLVDSAKRITEELVANKLNTTAKLTYLKSKNGKDITTKWTLLDGMPFQTKKKIIKNTDHKYYVRIDALARGQMGIKKTSFNPNKERIKPMIAMTVWIYDNNGKVIFKNRETLRDFEVLRSKSKVRRTVKFTVSETLSPEELLNMYILSLEKTLASKPL